MSVTWPTGTTEFDVRVLGTTMHVTELGAGPQVVFLHGNPTSAVLWRNVIGPVAAQGFRCLALDLIGMGRSGKPEVGYRLQDHIEHVDAVLGALDLRDPVLVGHDWGAVIALDHARRRGAEVAGVAVMEGHLHPIGRWDDLDDGGRDLFRRLRTPGVGEDLVIGQNFFVEAVLPSGVLRRLQEEELDAYRAPFLVPESRRPILQWTREIPIAGEPADVARLVTANQAVLADPAMPTLLLHGSPGAVVGAAEVAWCRRIGRSMTIASTGPGTHFLPEDQPTRIAGDLVAWLATVR